MLIRTIHIKKIYIILIFIILLILFLYLLFYNTFSVVFNKDKENKKDYIKWVDCQISSSVLDKTSKLDIESHKNNDNTKLNWIELIAYLASRYGNNFSSFKQKDLDDVVKKLRDGESIQNLTSDLKNYPYYFESYNAILNQFIGTYEIEISGKDTSKNYETKYGIKAFSPIAKNYSFAHYKDFGNSRSYGFKRVHLGNDLMGSIGTPIIAIESGIVEALGWNQYGGWRIGIKSFDGKRYYYYAHLRKDHPYAEGLIEGGIVTAGDVIGYLGMTGYSTKENVNNINIPHLHFGMQLIFDESQKDSSNEIWIDVYNIIEFLNKNKSEVYMDNRKTNDYTRKYDLIDPNSYD